MRWWQAVVSVLLLGILGCGAAPAATTIAPPEPTVAAAPAASESVWGEVPKQCA